MIKQNFLSPIGFKFVVHRLPNTSFFVQNATIPGLSINSTAQGTPFRTIYRPGENIEYEQFSITIKVDEDMQSFDEVMNWMVGMTFPGSFEEYANLTAGTGVYSDATLSILNNQKNPNLRIKLKDIYPISLGSIEMDTTQTGIVHASTTVTFQTNGFEIERVG